MGTKLRLIGSLGKAVLAGCLLSKCDLIALYDSLVIYSYNGKEDFAYCKELYLSDEPYVTLYSVKYEQKFRNLKIKDFDFIYGKSFDDLKKIFFLDCA